MARPSAPLTLRLPDEDAERVRRNHEQRIAAQEARPEPVFVRDVVLVDKTPTTVSHKLGRIPRWVGISAVRGAATTGSIQDNTLSTAGIDRTQSVVLKAIDWSATITVDLRVE